MLRQFSLATALISLCALPLAASDLPQPQGDVILTISGQVSATNVGETAQLDLDMLEAMDDTQFETTTIWTEGAHVFQGVALDVLVEELGITGETLRATAINDYAIEIPLSDAVTGGPIIAYRMDGATMSLRDKGPLWVIYPYDANPAYRSEVVYSRSIWQLDRIEAID